MIEEPTSCSDCGHFAAKASEIRTRMTALAQRLKRLYNVV